MTAMSVHFGENVKQKWLDVKIKSFMIKEQLGKKTKVLAVQLKYEP